MTGATIVAIVGVALAMVLAVRGVRARRLPRRDMILMALVWIVIIAAMAVVLQRSGTADAFLQR